MKIRFLPDQPILNISEDKLNLINFVSDVEDAVIHTLPPFVFGILGDWGSGKTSALRLLAGKLENRLSGNGPFFIPIWFNAWEYENEEQIIYPLLHAIKRSYLERFPFVDKSQKFLDSFAKLAITTTLAFTDIALRVTTKNVLGESVKLDDISKNLKQITDNPRKLDNILSDWVDTVGSIQSEFFELLKIYSDDFLFLNGYDKKDEVRFVIIVDDLDRCSPETSILVLENIKKYLNNPLCIYVLGLNPKTIYQGIKIKYRGLDINGREYLEKILNYSFYLPVPSPKNIAVFAIENLNRLIDDDASRMRYKKLLDEFGEILEICNFNNPRKVKRILNRYLLYIRGFEQELTLYHSSNIIKLLLLSEYFPELFQVFLAKNDMYLDLRKVINQDADQLEFSEKYGIDLTPFLSQINKMKILFSLEEFGSSKKKLVEHAQVVFSLTNIS